MAQKTHSPHRFPVTLALLTALVTLFMLTPMVLSITAGLVNNYSQGLASGLTTRWLEQVWEGYLEFDTKCAKYMICIDRGLKIAITTG
jgi:ABC-type spermidine/putrescine transport system permease subunit II